MYVKDIAEVIKVLHSYLVTGSSGTIGGVEESCPIVLLNIGIIIRSNSRGKYVGVGGF